MINGASNGEYGANLGADNGPISVSVDSRACSNVLVNYRVCTRFSLGLVWGG
jgi:hypothetical protein